MKLKAVILDWAGTTVDYGSMAPVRVLQKLFALHQVPLSMEEARAHMGLLKRDHIEKTLRIPRVREAWVARHGQAPDEGTVLQLFAEFIPLQMDCLEEHSTVIPGVVEAVERMRARGLKIGTTTGYTRPMLDMLIDKAGPQGYEPDCSLCPDDVGGGRPHPWMIFENAIRMRVYPLWALVKAGDTESDIEEGRNAGTWTVGVVATGNMIGLAPEQWNALDEAERGRRIAEGRSKMQAAGAHYAVSGVADMDWVFDDIEARLEKGERP